MHSSKLVKESQAFVNGRRLLEELDRQSFPVLAAFWHRLREYDTERLVIVSPEADQGTLGAYVTIQRALRALPENSLPLSDILPIGVRSKRFHELRREIEGVLHFISPDKKPPLDGYASEDTIIYRWPTS